MRLRLRSLGSRLGGVLTLRVIAAYAASRLVVLSGFALFTLLLSLGIPGADPPRHVTALGNVESRRWLRGEAELSLPPPDANNPTVLALRAYPVTAPLDATVEIAGQPPVHLRMTEGPATYRVALSDSVVAGLRAGAGRLRVRVSAPEISPFEASGGVSSDRRSLAICLEALGYGTTTPRSFDLADDQYFAQGSHPVEATAGRDAFVAFVRGAMLQWDAGWYRQTAAEGYAFSAAYDGSNRLTSLSYTDGEGVAHQTQFRYLGHTLTKKLKYRDSVLSEETRYVNDGFRTLQERNSANNVVNEYTWGLGLPGGIGGLLHLSQGGAAYSYLYDGKGNVTALLDANANVAAAYQYDPFGKMRNITGSVNQPFQFSTKPYDDKTGLSYYGYRFYVPALGRWLTRDPIGEAGGINLYGFAENDPINSIDPDGLSVLIPAIREIPRIGQAVWGAAIGIAAGLAAGAVDEERKRCLEVQKRCIEKCSDETLPTGKRCDQGNDFF